jgi:ankyrin repeat protein
MSEQIITEDLISAMRVGDKAKILAWLRTSNDVNSYTYTQEIRTQEIRTLLSRAAELGTSDIIQLLLDNEADANQSDMNQIDVFRHTQGFSPLMWAILHGNYRSVKLLLDHGANVDAKHRQGITPLMQAAYQGHTLVARLLLLHGAKVNARSNYGSTPLIEAVRGGREMMVRLLLKQGAEIVDGERPSLLRMAQSYGYNAIKRQLQDAGSYSFKGIAFQDTAI